MQAAMNTETERLREENKRYHQALEELSVHERMFYTLFESAHDAVFLLDGEYVSDCNRRATEMFRCSRDELVGVRFPELAAAVETEGASRNEQRFIDKLAQRDEQDSRFFEWTFRRSDGEDFRCEVSLAPLTLYERQFYFLSIRDISVRARIERDLRLRTAQLQSTLESLPFDFWINDTENRTYMQNSYSRQMWGRQNGHHMEEVTPDEEIKKHWRDSNRRALKGEVSKKEITYHIDGKEKIFRNIVAPILDNDTVIGILGLNIDITDYKATQQRLEESLRQVQILLKEVHHRVKNNLQIITSMINLEERRVDSRLQGILQDIENRINTMALIHEHLYTGESLAQISMPEYLESLSNSITASFNLHSRDIKIVQEVEEIILSIDTAIPLGIIANELITNSIKHAFPEGRGTITVGLVRREGTYRLTIADDGVGCPDQPDEQEGLGITLVHQLARQLQGDTSYASDSGCSITVTFPAEVSKQ
jgi:PAS domain S-box-containing protein